MYKGIYIALSGAILKQKHMDTFAQNIANANTSGYKKERISFKDHMVPDSVRPHPENNSRTMSEISDVVTDFSEGSIIRTGNQLDAAINGEGFFALEDNRYTRNGNFKIDSEGYLATQDNVRVLGSGGPISVPGTRVDISDSGEVFVDDIPVDQLRIVDFPDKDVLVKVEGGVFSTEEYGEEVTPKVSQGYLESSNVEVVREMVQMMTTLREFESYQKMIHIMDEAASQTINQMGRY